MELLLNQANSRHISLLAKCARVTELQSDGLEAFIKNLIQSLNLKPNLLIGAFMYLTKLRPHIRSKQKNNLCLTYHIILASLIIASKYNNQPPVKNVEWVKSARSQQLPFYILINKVNFLEKQLLQILDWKLKPIDREVFIEIKKLESPQPYQPFEKLWAQIAKGHYQRLSWDQYIIHLMTEK